MEGFNPVKSFQLSELHHLLIITNLVLCSTALLTAEAAPERAPRLPAAGKVPLGRCRWPSLPGHPRQRPLGECFSALSISGQFRVCSGSFDWCRTPGFSFSLRLRPQDRRSRFIEAMARSTQAADGAKKMQGFCSWSHLGPKPQTLNPRARCPHPEVPKEPFLFSTPPNKHPSLRPYGC